MHPIRGITTRWILSKNTEMIMYKVYKQSVLQHSLIAYTCSSTQLSGLTKDAFNAYLFTDGLPLGLYL